MDTKKTSSADSQKPEKKFKGILLYAQARGRLDQTVETLFRDVMNATEGMALRHSTIKTETKPLIQGLWEATWGKTAEVNDELKETRLWSFRYWFVKLLWEEYQSTVKKIAARVLPQRRPARSYGIAQPVRTTIENMAPVLFIARRRALIAKFRIAKWKSGIPANLPKPQRRKR